VTNAFIDDSFNSRK